MKISQKLVGSFVSVSLLTSVVGGVAITQSQKIAEKLAIAEAEHVAQVLAVSIAHDAYYDKKSITLEDSDELQHYVNLLHDLQKRDLVVVNRQKQILADAVPENVGTIFEHDQGNEIYQTIQDGNLRSFLEKSVDYPQGIKLIVTPLKNEQNQINGAVILEWSSLYDEAIAQARPTMIVISITSLSCIILALSLGWQISSSIAKPLQLVTAVAQQVTQESNFDLQVPVITKDETGILATAFNDLIKRVKTLLTEKEQHSTELQQALTQLHKTQLQLVQTEKMSSLGQLVAGVAHEINNPVSFIHGNITYIDNYTQDLLKLVQAYQAHYPNPPQTLQATLDEVELDFLNEDLFKLLQSMKVGTERIGQIVLSLRNFSRLDESEFKTVDLHEGIENTLLILQHRLKAKLESPAIEVVKNYSQLPSVECCAGQLNQAFMNLLANAIDTLEESARHQRKSNLQIQPGTIWISTQVTADNQVQIAIADNGSGIPKTLQTRIFDPFFTTKPIGKGTGLGLSISYQIVTQKHHGKMWYNSTPGEGTKFVIEIPICQP
ncbi:integral membrane sensor signal transduction histidine kinase [Nostoc commune NIES-4072]|uniref:histidine kinase n=1 Tax=Nostoc commune NIES-4072 TaxID=2005467 RepID=A0A2R5FZL0_NOSCO|nr:ATP-binding protein [Nostoc commune]BBD67345.1 integral membrane sensor signal transduction histidine kinase [Nostoc commune HK-02]GBG21673.1 integral membrane sensor signal transduction histidine kinase [Nostoc commune NIES-4072]